MNPIEYEYREWLVSLAFGLCEGFGDYRELFEYLYSREFVWIIDRDRNRAADGMPKRYLRRYLPIPEHSKLFDRTMQYAGAYDICR